jgi:hypothetical protein
MRQRRMTIGRGVLVLAVLATLAAATTGAATATPADSAPLASTTQSPRDGPRTLATATACRVVWPYTSCKTGTIPSSIFRTIHYRMCAASNHYADWQVKDASNGYIVRQGRVEAPFCTGGDIGGLYGKYWGWVFNTRAGATAYIDNG